MAQYKIILDTNIWISFAIGKRMLMVRDYPRSQVLLGNAILTALRSVRQRPSDAGKV